VEPEFRPTRTLLDDRWRDLGFDRLLPEERDFIILWWLEAEVFNGGFHQYFHNSSGDAAPEALVALEVLGAHTSARILRDALTELACEPFVRDTEQRRTHLMKLDRSIDRFDRVTDELQDLPEDFVSLAIARVKTAYEDNGVL
jgi:hypothetical protein